MKNSPKYIISEFFEFKSNPKLIKEAEENGKPLIMTGILQKADTVNRNGRVYPYNILKREVNKYMELVENNIAGGQLDHPDCIFLANSNILTKSGWKLLSEISEEEEILTLNPNTKKIEIQKIDKKIAQKYNGDIYHIHGLGIDIKVTPNHRFLVYDRKDMPKYITAEEINNTYTNKLTIPRNGIWEGIEDEFFILKGENNFKENSPNTFKENFSQDLKIKLEDWMEFMGWYLSEGSCTGSNGYDYKKERNYSIKITQKKEKNKLIILDLFNKLPFNKRIVKYKNGKTDYIFTDYRLHQYLLKLGNSTKKYIPEEIKNYSPRLLKILFNAFLLGDGRNINFIDKISNKIYNRKSVFSTSKKLIEDLQEILFKTGGHGNISTYQPKNRTINEFKNIEEEIDNGDGTLSMILKQVKVERVIKSENSHLQYNLNISKSKNIYLNKNFLKIEKIQGDGMIYCVRVKNGNFYTMNSGKSHWTGNSAIVSLADVSHRVIDLWWQDKDLYGKVLIAEETNSGRTIKGLLKAGFTLGISSRGVGSVKTISGKDIVQDDFELIAFDFVSSPSTPGAYLFKEGKEVYTYGMIPLTDNHYKNITSDFKEIKKQTEDYMKFSALLNNNFWKNL